MRLLADTRNENRGVVLGAGVDEDTALVVYNVGQSGEYTEVGSPGCVTTYA